MKEFCPKDPGASLLTPSLHHGEMLCVTAWWHPSTSDFHVMFSPLLQLLYILNKTQSFTCVASHCHQEDIPLNRHRLNKETLKQMLCSCFFEGILSNSTSRSTTSQCLARAGASTLLSAHFKTRNSADSRAHTLPPKGLSEGDFTCRKGAAERRDRHSRFSVRQVVIFLAALVALQEMLQGKRWGPTYNGTDGS